MDQLGAIELFNKVVETGSFSEAGRQSNLAPSSVSRRVADLEAWVGARLLHRTTRKLSLTEVGRVFHERTRTVLLDLEEARIVAAQLEAKPSGLVRITLPASLEAHVVVATSLFGSRWPAVSFGLTATERKADLVAEGFDLAIRAGQLADSTLRARKIAEVPRSLCASPAYLATAPPLEHPRNIEQHQCLTLGRGQGHDIWRFTADTGIVEVRASGRFSANSGNMLATAAQNGGGLMLSADWILGPLVARGKLVKLLPAHLPYPATSTLFAVHAYQRFVPPKVKMFIDFLVAHLGGDYDWSVAPAVPGPS